MAINISLKVPTNAIVAGGREPVVLNKRIETATNCKPGRLVKKDTTDADVEVCGDMGNPIGWLGYEQAAASMQPTNEDTVYTALDIAPVLCGGGFVMVASLVATQQVSMGMDATPSANGEVGSWVDGDTIVGKFLESKTYSASSQDVMVLSLI